MSESVGVRPGLDGIGTLARLLDHLVQGAADDIGVVAFAAGHRVMAGTAVDQVVLVGPLQVVRLRTAPDLVFTAPLSFQDGVTVGAGAFDTVAEAEIVGREAGDLRIDELQRLPAAKVEHHVGADLLHRRLGRREAADLEPLQPHRIAGAAVEIGDGIVAPALGDHEDILAAPARQGVVAAGAVDRVVAGAALDSIGLGVAGDLGTAGRRDNGVVGGCPHHVRGGRHGNGLPADRRSRRCRRPHRLAGKAGAVGGKSGSAGQVETITVATA